MSDDVEQIRKLVAAAFGTNDNFPSPNAPTTVVLNFTGPITIHVGPRQAADLISNQDLSDRDIPLNRQALASAASNARILATLPPLGRKKPS